MRVEVDHPEAGPLGLVASPLRLSASPVTYRLPPPLLGQHTDEVLTQVLAMAPAEIAALREAGVV
jgi:crotonobetainyl-CoA:carnitine CoA-transferase CaiB-like acyl-CoA transferase